MKQIAALSALLFFSLILASSTLGESSESQRVFGTIPVSTHSEEARKFLELAIDKYENAMLDDAAVFAKHATEKDPEFPLGHAFLSFVARRDTPDAAALARAKSLLSRATPDEQLLVRWMTGVQGGDLLPAIASMNDLLNRYSRDKHVLYLISEWLYFQQDYERARSMMEKARQIDPDFAPALNKLGYAYLETGTPDPAKAIALLKRYAELQPGQPSPEESLGQVLRYAGDDRGSLEHYAEALQLDPSSVSGRIGLADTLTLAGEFSTARNQYAKAFSFTETPRDEFHASYQSALVSFWEGKTEEGRKELDALAEKARSAKEPYAQFEANFGRALLAASFKEEVERLKTVESFLKAPIPGMAEPDRGIALASVLRERVRITALDGQPDAGTEVIHQLEALSAKTRDLVVENCYESARGYVLFAGGDFDNAADELSTDPQDPLVVRQLAIAQEKRGNTAAASAARTRLKFMRASTAEWYLATHAAAH